MRLQQNLVVPPNPHAMVDSPCEATTKSSCFTMALSEDRPEAQMTPATAVGYASDGGYALSTSV